MSFRTGRVCFCWMFEPLPKCFDDVEEQNPKFETPRLRFRRASPTPRAWVDVSTGDPSVDTYLAAAIVRSLRAAVSPPAWKPAAPKESSEKDTGGVEVSSFMDRVAQEMLVPPACLVVPIGLIPNAGQEQKEYAARSLGFSQRFSVVPDQASAAKESCPCHVFSGSVPAAVAAVASFCATFDVLLPKPSSS